MDRPERADAQLPAWPASPLPNGLPQKPFALDDPFDGFGAPTGRGVTFRLIWRAFRRHWWQVLGLWIVGSIGLGMLAYNKIKPTYGSRALLEVKPASRSVLAPKMDPGEFQTAMETQVALITSPDVLGAAVLDDQIAGLAMIRNSLDPQEDLLKALRVGIVPRTQLIMVSMSTENPTDATLIIEAVINSYLKAALGWTDRETQAQMAELKGMQKRYEVDQDSQRARLKSLYEGAVQRDLDLKDKDRVSVTEYRQLRRELGLLRIDLITAEGTLGARREKARESAQMRPRHALQGKDLEEAVEEEFLALPPVEAILDRIRDAEDRRKEVERRAKQAGDPAITRLNREIAGYEKRYKELWAKHSDVLHARMARPSSGDEQQQVDNALIREAEIEVAALKIREESLIKQLKAQEVVTIQGDQEALDVEYAKADLDSTTNALNTIKTRLAQLETEGANAAKVSLVAAPRPIFKPESNKRLALMAAAPIVVMVMVMGLFVLIEARAGRVVDPDDLPSRVRIGVIGVVPPLPSLEQSRGPRAARDEKRRVEEFVQSLDQLRVTLCAGPGGVPGRRCVLITSACGGEGKTTLAAQLAGRCANAGLSTLLVDADLRRPSLGELLEVPEGQGLADVLAGEVEPEAVMVPIASAGGFHLLPAGTLGMDPSRLLQGDRLGTLIAQFRATFDVVIIDAPPVLAVPDALLLGRWTDGAVLAVRHEASRYPLVERANRRLASIGIPVFGAVVNGVRAGGSYYGAYHYYSAYHYASTGPVSTNPSSPNGNA